MKRVIVVVVLVAAAAILGLWRTQGGVRNGLSRVVGAASEQGNPREEIRRSFELQPGARVEIAGINGKVEIQTSDTRTAEVYVLRTAGSSEALARREVTIEQTANGLLVKGKQVGHGFWEHLFGSHAREEVTIKAPRQIALALKGINGRVNGGDIEGSVEIKGINGRVLLGQANDSADISGINGNVSVGLNRLTAAGVRVNGVNGGIELRLGAGVNADLTANGMNGSVRSEIPGVTVEKNEFGSRYSARIGTGGSPITISGINGSVRLIGVPTPAAATNDTKPLEKTSSKASEK